MDRSGKIVIGALAAGVWACLVYQVAGGGVVHAQEKSADKKLVVDELTVKRINVVDETGKTRIVLSNSDRFPNPVLKGKEYPRSIKPAGLVFYKPDGDEAGGVALAEVGGNKKNFFALDYVNSEAIGFGMTELADGKFSSGISILDRVPLEADIEKVGSVGTERISISNDNGEPEVVLRDAKGKPRIRLSIAKDDTARIEIKDAEGKTVFAAP